MSLYAVLSRLFSAFVCCFFVIPKSVSFFSTLEMGQQSKMDTVSKCSVFHAGGFRTDATELGS